MAVILLIPVIFLMAMYENSSEPRNSNKWFVDSDCSNHLNFNKYLFSSYARSHASSMELGNSNTVKAVGIRTIQISIVVHGKRVKCVLNNILHIHELGY